MLLISLLLPTMVWAGVVDESEARQRAEAFVRQRSGGKTNVLRTAVKGRKVKGRGATSASDYYIFNVSEGGGFVIVSGDDRTEVILGYADSGNIDETAMPEGLKVLLDDYSEQMARLEDSAAAAQDGRRQARARTAIAPLIQTRWNQAAPYNNNCPEVSYTVDENVIKEMTVTGCVATSMAQVMYYHKWPEGACTAIPGYTTGKLGLTLDGLPATTFNWNAMKTTYSSSATGDAAVAVAQLMQYCGWSVQMNYNRASVGGSSAFNASIPYALKSYFGYDSGARSAKRSSYTYGEWVDLIYGELAEKRPVVLGGQSAGGGHSFVCDGYEGEDYFHINWGWGGGGDGFFRLAVLQPYEQGAGGSSTMDGFNFGQEAIVGIQKPTAGTKAYCLSLEDFYLKDYPSSHSQTFTRDSAEDPFTGINLIFSVCSFQSGSNSFDIAAQLVDESGEVKHTMEEAKNQSMVFNKNLIGAFTNMSIPSSVGAGTYYIKVMSRPAGGSDWMECFDGEQFMMTAVISDTELTLNDPRPKPVTPASVAFTVKGNKTVGYEQEVVASITGGSGDYRGDVVLRVDGKAVMGKEVEIPAGETVEAHFTYIPTTAGDNVLTLYTSKSGNDQITGSTIVTISESDATNTQELSFAPTINNLNGGKLYGNAIRATVRVTNPDTEHSYVGHVNCSMRIYNNATDIVEEFADAQVISKSVVIGKNASIDVTFDYDLIDPSKFYRLRFSYLQGKETADGPIVSSANGNAIAVGEGVALHSSDGSVTIHEKGATLNCGTSACVDLRGISSFDGVAITPSSNPNCIYLLATGVEAPAALSSCNLVCGTSAEALTAASLSLQDGYDFYTPVGFTATNVSYTRTFSLAANGTSGWNTQMLPFDVSSVSCEVIGTVDWFHSGSDTGKNFWVRTFTSDGPGTVVFDYADAMEANTPYIIAVPDDRWGSAWLMTDRVVTFSGTNAVIEKTRESSIGGNNFSFCGNTVASSQKDVYLLNAEGSSFVLASESTAVPAFRGWFNAIEISALTMPALSIGSPETTGIGPTPSPLPLGRGEAGAWFDLSGRKMNSTPTKPGCYIINGKKIVIR